MAARIPPAIMLLVISLSACGGSKGIGATATVTSSPDPSGVPVVAAREWTETIADPALEPVLRLPVVSGVDGAAAIEAAVEAEMRARASAYRAGVEAAPPQQDGDASWYRAGFETTLARPGALCFRFDEGTYYQGAVSGNQGVFTACFDPATGDAFGLDDIVLPGGPALLADLVERSLADDFYAGDGAALAAYLPEVVPAALRHWVLSPDGIEISFDPGLAGPDQMGVLTVVIPHSLLGGILDPTGPASPDAYD